MHEQTTPETRRIPLRRRDGTIRAYALVDAADYVWLVQWTWCLNAGGYAQRSERRAGKRRKILMHRQILGLESGDPRQGDHRNRDRLDYRRDNLRIAERGQRDNLQNVRSRAGSSRYRGVSWSESRQKWEAKAQLAGRTHHLGRFADEAEAAAAALAFRRDRMPFSMD